MNGLSPLARRLAEPSLALSLEALCNAWFVQSIEARLPLLGVLAGRTDVLAKVRGAWGRRLMEGASAEAIEGRACPFDPPCALDVFFREQVRSGRHAVPKPYVFEADRDGPDLIVRLKLFGFASAWTPAASDRLVEALNGHVDWRALSGMANLRAPRVASLRVSTTQGVALASPREAVTLRFVTPFEDEERIMLDRPSSFVARLARRVWGLARWHDAELDVSWEALSDAWNACRFELPPSFGNPLDRRSRGRRFSQSAVTGEMAVSDAVACLWPILALGQTCGAGRGAVQGLGRFEIGPP